MRTMTFALTGAAAIALALAVSAVDPASAASPRKAQSCNGLHDAYQNGQCVHTQFINPDRVPDPCAGGAVCYRSSHKHKPQIHKAS